MFDTCVVFIPIIVQTIHILYIHTRTIYFYVVVFAFSSNSYYPTLFPLHSLLYLYFWLDSTFSFSILIIKLLKFLYVQTNLLGSFGLFLVLIVFSNILFLFLLFYNKLLLSSWDLNWKVIFETLYFHFPIRNYSWKKKI